MDRYREGGWCCEEAVCRMHHLHTTTRSTTTSSKTTAVSAKTTGFETTIASTTEVPAKLAVMLIGGYGRTGMMSDVEVIDPFISESDCIKPPDFPEPRYGLIAELFDGSPIICSGYSNGGDRNDCYRYDQERWVSFPTALTFARRYATSIIINNDTMWLSGGDRKTSQSSSETLHRGGTFHLTTPLSEPMEHHCSSRINDTHFFIAGNFYGTQTQAYIVEVDEKSVDTYKYTKLPNMKQERYGGACMTMTNSANGEVKLLVAGGYRFGSFTTTEIYSMQTKEWINGPHLPRGFLFGSYVQYPSSKDFVMVGGKDDSGVIFDNFMRYNQNSEQFELMPANLESARWDFGATLVMIDDDC